MKKEPTGYPSIDKPWRKYYSAESFDVPLPKCTAYEFLYEKNKEHLSDVALNYYDAKITYGQLFDNIEYAAKAFSALGIKQGDIVILCSVNIPETVYAIYGLNRLGAISNMVDPRTNENQLREYINEANAKFVLSIDSAYPVIQKAMQGSTAEQAVVVSPAESLPPIMQANYQAKNPAPELESNAIWWKEFILQGVTEKPVYPVYKENSCFVIAHTGGTSGTPKGVMLSDDALNAIAHCYYYIPTPLERGQRYFNDLPPFIIYGLSFALHMTLCRGFEVIIYPIFDSAQFPKLYAKYKPNHFCAVPDHLNHLITDPAIQDMDLSFTIAVGSGGDSLNTKLEERTNEFLKNHGCQFEVTKGYGMTETGAVAISTFPNANKVGSVGIPLFINNMKIMDLELNTELSYNQSGEIWLSGPSIMLGYYKNPEATEEIIVTDENGTRWIRTGDLGHITKDGLLIHEGRIRRIYLTAVDGQPAKIFPTLIESVIKQSPNVYDCAVVGRFMKSSSYYEPIAYVVLKSTDKSKYMNIKQELASLCKNGVPTYMCPTEYRFVNELPHTPIGKVDFRALEKAAIIAEN